MPLRAGRQRTFDLGKSGERSPDSRRTASGDSGTHRDGHLQATRRAGALANGHLTFEVIMQHEPHLFAAPSPAFSTRRSFLSRAGNGLGILALAGLLDQKGLLAAEDDRSLNPLAPRPPHFPAKAKSVIWLFMNGGPSQVDTWDYKPELEKQRRQGTQRLRQGHRLLRRSGRPADEVALLLETATASRGRGRRRSFRPCPSTSMTSPLSTPVSPKPTTIRRPCSRSTPA